MTMRQALAESRNVPAVKAINEEGVDNAFAFLDKMFVVNDNERYESAALGGAEVSTKEMAGAYAAFGNNGEYHEPYTIRKIVFPDGRELNTEPEPTQVMEDYTGYMITDMLKRSSLPAQAQKHKFLACRLPENRNDELYR